MSRPSKRTIAGASMLALSLAAGIAMATASAASRPAAPADRQEAYAAAAAEYGVPESVLLGVSYLESRWDTNGGRPSTSAGYGPMHLTDVDTATAGVGTHHDDGSEDPRGDIGRPVLHPKPGKPGMKAGKPGMSAATLRTVDTAAKATGEDTAKLRTDPTQNIRGGAALLAKYEHELGAGGSNPANWYGAVARYSGATDTASAKWFADQVFSTITSGEQRVTDDGQQVRLAAQPDLKPNTAQLGALDLRQPNASETECPPGLGCEWIPAPYEQFKDTYGNHDLANRPESQKINYIIIHDTEETYDRTVQLVQDPTYVSWNYTVRSADGHVAQHVKAKDVAWHAGNWYVNSKSVGIEQEGYGAQATWMTEALYRSTARLVRYIAARNNIPLDRAHILGHGNVPGTDPASVGGMHWDPGPYWDWSHFFDLLGAPFHGSGNPHSGLVTIDPDYEQNQLTFTGCDTAGQPCATHASSALILHTEPSEDAPQLVDLGLHPDGSPGTMGVSDHSSRVEAGQRYAVADRQGDWTAIWYLGQKGWFHNPKEHPTADWSAGLVATPKAGKDTIPVYGVAYPEASAYPSDVKPKPLTPLQYTLSAGQEYSVGLITGSEYYNAVTFDVADHVVVRGKTKYVQIQFGHRVAYVKKSDVDLHWSAS